MEKKKTFGPMVTLLAIIKKKVVPFQRGPLLITLCLGYELHFMSQLSTHILDGKKWFLIQTRCALRFVLFFNSVCFQKEYFCIFLLVITFKLISRFTHTLHMAVTTCHMQVRLLDNFASWT